MSDAYTAHDAERAVLAACLRGDADRADVLTQIRPEDMHHGDHRALLSLLRSMHHDGRPVDDITVAQAVMAYGEGAFGGLHYVTGLPSALPSSANLAHYVGLVIEAATRRRMRDATRGLLEAIGDGTQSIESLSAQAELLTGMARSHSPEDAWTPLDVAAHEAIDASGDACDARLRGESLRLPGAPTPPELEGWAGILPELVGGEVHVIAARPGAGKSALARQVAMHAARHGVGVGVVSLEMSPIQLARLELAKGADLVPDDIRRGMVEGRHAWDRLRAAGRDMQGLPVLVSWRQDLRMDDIVAQVHGLPRALSKRGAELGLLVIDYLQIIAWDRGRGLNETQALADITRACKHLATRYECAVVLLSQLNRESAKTGKRPGLPDLRGSGAIEQDAGTVTFVHRLDASDDTPAGQRLAPAELIVAKNRYGSQGTAPVYFDGPSTTFRHRVESHGGDW